MYFYGAMCIKMQSRLVCIGLYQIVQNISQYYYVDARHRNCLAFFQWLELCLQPKEIKYLVVGSLASEFLGWTWNSNVGIPTLDIGIPT